MALKQIFKISRKTFVNPSAWLGYDTLANNTRTIWNVLKDLFTPAKPLRTETFEESIKRQQITEENLKATARSYFLYSLFFTAIGLIAIGGGFYLLFSYGTISGWLLATATSFLFFVYAFRFNFWYFQIKHRKLGCTFEEWWQGKPYENKESK